MENHMENHMGKSQKYSTLIFDLGGVLIDWNPRYLYRELFEGDDAAMERFLSDICHKQWNHQFDAGRPFAEGIAEAQSKFPDQTDLIGAYFTHWETMLGGAIEGTVGVLNDCIEGNYEVYALTNWSAETFGFAQRRFEFLNKFKGILVSGEIAMAKPDTRIFRHFLELYGLQAQQCLFIDDVAENIAGAREVGIEAVHFRDAQTLRKELSSLGVL